MDDAIKLRLVKPESRRTSFTLLNIFNNMYQRSTVETAIVHGVESSLRSARYFLDIMRFRNSPELNKYDTNSI